MLSKDANILANSIDPDLGLHCLPRPLCLKTEDHYGIITSGSTADQEHTYISSEHIQTAYILCSYWWEWSSHEVSTCEPPRDKTNNVAVRPAKTQISLGIRPVWSESSLCAQWEAKGPSFLHADSEDSDQTRLIWVFAGRTLTSLVL